MEVKVRETLPLCPVGLNVLPATPGPDQLPVLKPGAVKVARFRAGELLHRLVVPSVGVWVVTTSTEVAVVLAQASSGLKIKEILPDKPAGLN